MQYSSKVVEQAVEALAKFPGIGKKSALRMALYLMKLNEDDVGNMAQAMINLKTKLKTCERCGNIAEDVLCQICQDKNRDQQLICVVEDLRDVMAIENTGQYKGVYHLLGGLIAPLEGKGPEDLTIAELEHRVSAENTLEVIIALSATLEGDTTTFYLARRLKPLNIKVSTLARGLAVGGEIEYADELTLARSIATRNIL